MTFFEFILLYLLGMSDSIKGALGFASTVTILVCGIASIPCKVEIGQVPRMIKGFIITAFVVGAFAVFLPSTKTVAIILGGSIVLDVARSESVQSVAKHGMQVIDNELKKFLEVKPNDPKTSN